MGAYRFLKIFLFCALWVFGIQLSSAHDDFIEVIAQSKSAVVSIEVSRTKKSVKSKEAVEVLGDNADFFSNDINDFARKGRGSGFVVSYKEPNIYILTAAHVVRGASKIKVVFFNSEKKKAKVVWFSRKNDVALLEVEGKDSFEHFLKLSDDVVVEGQGVLAIAGSFDLSVSSSVGIVSAVDVILPNKKAVKLVQTDAAVNPGSSGGPLINKKGDVIGLISNIYTKTGTFSGAAFAIPAALVKDLMEAKNN